MSALIQLINTVSRHLQDERIPHALVGGVAVAIWGRPRATEDIDLILDLQEEQLGAFQQHLNKHGIRMNLEKARRAIQKGDTFPLYDHWSIHWIDARPPARPIDRITLERAVPVELSQEEVPVATPEDTVLGKLLAGGVQDLMDAKSILLRRAGRLDMDYLTNRVRELEVRENWARISGGNPGRPPAPASTTDA